MLPIDYALCFCSIFWLNRWDLCLNWIDYAFMLELNDSSLFLLYFWLNRWDLCLNWIDYAFILEFLAKKLCFCILEWFFSVSALFVCLLLLLLGILWWSKILFMHKDSSFPWICLWSCCRFVWMFGIYHFMWLFSFVYLLDFNFLDFCCCFWGSFDEGSFCLCINIPAFFEFVCGAGVNLCECFFY